MAVGFMGGSIVSKMLLDTTKWSNSIRVVKGDQDTLKGKAAKNAEGFRKMGTAMTVAGAAIVTGLILAVNKAADAQETFAKFDTIFKDVGAEAEAMSVSLQTGFGLSEVAAKDMLGATGDLLTGLGMGSDVALDLSVKTQQLAVDLASFTNFSGGAKGAADALTKAMLGENESVKALGITIRDSMVMEQLAAEGKDKLTGLSLSAAKAEAVLTLAVRQSKNAIGDYERTSGSLVNQKRLLAAQTENLVNTLGAHLIPVATKVVTKVTEIVTKISDWMKANPKLTGTIIKIAAGAGAFLAVTGPIVMMLPKIVAGIGLLKGGIISLGTKMLWFVATPAGLIVVALAAIAIGFMKVKKAQNEANKAAERYNEVSGKFEDKLKGIATQAGLTSEEFETLKKKYKGNINVMALAIKKGEEGIELQKAMNEVGKERVEQQEAEKDAIDATLPSLADMVAGLGSTSTAIKDVTKETKTYLDYLDDMGLKTLKEKGDRVTELEGFVKDLDTAYKNGKISLHDYKTATDAAKKEIEDLSTEIVETAVPTANDLWDALQQAPEALTEIAEFPGKIEKPAKEGARRVKTAWAEAADGLKTKWSNMWSSFLTGPISLKTFGDAFKTFVGNMKTQFFDMIGQMIAKWTTGFLVKLVSGTKDAVGTVVGTLKDVTSGALDLAKGFSPTGAIATGIGAAVGTFLGGLLGPKGPSANDTRLIKDNTWATNQNVLNAVGGLDSIKWSLWNLEPVFNDIKLTLWDQTGILGMINDKIGRPPAGTSKSGRGTPSGASAVVPGAINIQSLIKNVNINGIMISERDWARKSLIPEIFQALKQRALKSKLQSILGIS